MHKKVQFHGVTYWRHTGTMGIDNISPLNHYDYKGNLLVDESAISFAIVQNNNIMRYGDVIGTVDDLIGVE